MTATEILKLIPEKTFDILTAETKVDHQVKKLTGETIFKLVLYSMLSSNKPSLRIMEKFISSATFKCFNRRTVTAKKGRKTLSPHDCKYNSIRDRICTMEVSYFEKLFEQVFIIYNKELKEETALSKTDSTFISLAAKLFSTAMEFGGDKTHRHVKYSVVMKGSLPMHVKAFTDQTYASEEMALAEVIDDADGLQKGTIVFDRGLKSRDSFDRFTTDNKYFITRSLPGPRHEVHEKKGLGAKPDGSTVTIVSDEVAYLFGKKGKKSTFSYRLITATIDASGEEICFISNLMEEDAYMIAHWYKQRWEIEVFFKFIKQELNASHLVSRDESGLKIMLYMTMIVASLIIVYRKLNKIKGYKIAKAQFEMELNDEMTKVIVRLCGGDPNNVPSLWK
ncbi:IS4 family transposase, partial [Parasediminibacterium sp. JCM 36343]|uniref:IS4 family transposase n=1 Tax=Parasediminibacterium sp. JCM 36343 TaxID=3374279 RepID=UPI00397C4ACD